MQWSKNEKKLSSLSSFFITYKNLSFDIWVQYCVDLNNCKISKTLLKALLKLHFPWFLLPSVDKSKVPSAVSLVLEFPRSSGWMAEGCSYWLSTRGVLSSSSPWFKEFSQFHYILCFWGCRNRKSWSEVLEKSQKSARSLLRSSILTTPSPRLRPILKATSTPPLSNSVENLPWGYPD